MTDASRSKKPQNYIRYGGILLLLAAIRIFEAATAETSWRSLTYDSTGWLMSVCLLAAVVSLITVKFAFKRYPPAITILLGVLAGGTSSLIVTSIPGMLIGLVIGVGMAFSMTRRISLRMLKFAGLFVAPAILVGWFLGFCGAKWEWLRVDAQDEPGTAGLLCTGLLIVAVFWNFALTKWLGKAAWHRMSLRVLVFFIVSLAFVTVGVQFDTQRRIDLLNREAILAWNDKLVPFGYRNLTRGFEEPSGLGLTNGLSKSQAKLARVFHVTDNIWLDRGDGDFRSDGFSEMDFSQVKLLHGDAQGLTDEALLAFRNSSGIAELRLAGTDITDTGLQVLENMPQLVSLGLSTTRISGDGLKHLHPQAPLSTVWLNDTNVNDEALAHLAPYPLTSLDLSGTKVTGREFWRLHGDTFMPAGKAFVRPGLNRLVLSNSAFREENIELLPNSVNYLDMDGVPLSNAGIESLVCRYFGRGRGQPDIWRLSIADTGVDGDAAKLLADIQIEELRIDATHLTIAVCEALAQTKKIELIYEADDLELNGGSLEEMIQRYTQIRDQLMQLKSQKGIPLPPYGQRPAVSMVIRGLTVKREMVEALRAVDDCYLQGATIDGKGSVGAQLEPHDLPGYFPSVSPVE